MTERTKTGNRRPPLSRTSMGSGVRTSRRNSAMGPASTGGLVLLPWALALLGASAVLAAATVLGG
jgi:hypothetical protein